MDRAAQKQAGRSPIFLLAGVGRSTSASYPEESSIPLVYEPWNIEVPEGFVDGPKTRKEFADYYRVVSRFDRDVGLVIDELERQGVLHNTVVIVTSDNGRPFSWGKLTLYDDGIKTPFILHWPRSIESSGTREQLISMVDLAPTILEWAGLPIPGDMEGYSFATVFSSETQVTREFIFAERNWHATNAHERAVRSLTHLYKENQFPLHGSCIDNPYASKPSFKEYAKIHQRAPTTEFDRDCFSDSRAPIELRAAGAVGNTRSVNLVNDEAQAWRIQMMRRELNNWRASTEDFDYKHYTSPSR